ncbi:MAG TPA: hypothetical protein VJ932_08810, partial [Alkalispirochaeta sp.]|nr:hypothetical protein [Alkalispirochaeta sp.]
ENGTTNSDADYSTALSGTWLIDYSSDEDGSNQDTTTRAGDYIVIDATQFDEMDVSGSTDRSGTISNLGPNSFNRTLTTDDSTQYVEYSVTSSSLDLKFYSDSSKTTFYGRLVCSKQ